MYRPAEGWKYFGQREGTLGVLWAKGRHAGSTLGEGKALGVLWAKGRHAESTLGKGKATPAPRPTLSWKYFGQREGIGWSLVQSYSSSV